MPVSTAEPDPARTPIPLWTRGTPPDGLTPIPSATGGIGTCEPTWTLTPSATYTPSDTPTVTPTDTPTLTPTATQPSCASDFAEESCGMPGPCYPQCQWVAPEITPPELSCDDDPAPTYQVTVVATECDMGPPFYMMWVKVEYSYDGVWQGPFSMSQVSPPTNPRKWEAVLTGLDFKPTLYRISYGTVSYSSHTRGIRRIDVEYCCE